jgi:Flp pilus assembly protein TadD
MALIEHGRGSGRALALVDQAVLLDPSVANFHNSRGFLHRHNRGALGGGGGGGGGSDEVAAEAYRTAVSLAPQLVAPHADLAHALHYGVADGLADPGGADFNSYRAALEEAATRYEDALAASAAAAAAAASGGATAAAAPSGPWAPLSLAAEVDLRNDLAIALQKVGRPGEAAATLAAASRLDPSHLQTAGNLVVALKQSGDLVGAEAAGRVAVGLAPGSAQVRYNHGLTYQALGRHEDAASEWRAALAADPALVPALASLGHSAGHGGDLDAAKSWYGKALAALVAHRLGRGGGGGGGGRGSGGGSGATASADTAATGEEGSMRLQVATACVPQIYGSPAHADAVRAEFTGNLRGLLGLKLAPGNEGPDEGGDNDNDDGDNSLEGQSALCRRASELLIADPLTSVGSGALGYYLIYTGHNDVAVRRLLAAAYWCGAPAVRFQAPFLLGEHQSGSGGDGRVNRTTPVAQQGGPPSTAVRVGFMSAFFYHHSVGLLTRGVICGLASRALWFHVTLLYPSPLETVSPVGVAARCVVDHG